MNMYDNSVQFVVDDYEQVVKRWKESGTNVHTYEDMFGTFATNVVGQTDGQTFLLSAAVQTDDGKLFFKRSDTDSLWFEFEKYADGIFQLSYKAAGIHNVPASGKIEEIAERIVMYNREHSPQIIRYMIPQRYTTGVAPLEARNARIGHTPRRGVNRAGLGDSSPGPVSVPSQLVVLYFKLDKGIREAG